MASSFVSAYRMVNCLKGEVMKIDNKTLKDKAFTPEEVGQEIAYFFKWNGVSICAAFLEALEDSNFHSLKVELSPIIEKHLKG